MTPPKDKAMSNRERAEAIYREFMTHAHELEIYSIETSIERAFDAKDAEWKQDAADNYIQGQKRMRESAEQAACIKLGCECRERIRALPIEGE